MSDVATRAAIGRVLVLGTGTMGQGIAQVTAQAGIETHLYDVEAARIDAALAAVRGGLDRLVTKGKLDGATRDATLGRLAARADLAAACEGIDLVIEAAPEQMSLKVEVLSKVKALAPAHAIVASNTSSLSITEIGNRIGAPERTIGLHFFNPPPVMELLEIVRGLQTDAGTLETCVELAKRLGKTSIVVRDVPGFATSRLGVAIGAEAMRMFESGVASIADIDRAMELGYRHPMGPLKLTDLVGLDVRLRIADYLHQALGAERFAPPAILRRLVAEGKLGKKSGHGFYDWSQP